MSSVQSVAATPNTSLRGETDSPDEHLRRHELGRPDRAGARVVAIDLARDAEVDQHHAVLAEDQVARLHVAVHDLLVVHVLERLASLDRVLDRLRRPAARVAAAARAPRRGRRPRTSSITR